MSSVMTGVPSWIQSTLLKFSSSLTFDDWYCVDWFGCCFIKELVLRFLIYIKILLSLWTTQLFFEIDDYLVKIVKSPDTSHWMTWFQAHRISDAIKAKCSVNIIPVSCSFFIIPLHILTIPLASSFIYLSYSDNTSLDTKIDMWIF